MHFLRLSKKIRITPERRFSIVFIFGMRIIRLKSDFLNASFIFQIFHPRFLQIKFSDEG